MTAAKIVVLYYLRKRTQSAPNHHQVYDRNHKEGQNRQRGHDPDGK